MAQRFLFTFVVALALLAGACATGGQSGAGGPQAGSSSADSQGLEPHTIYLLVYADAGYRANALWQTVFKSLLEKVNGDTEKAFKVTFKIRSFIEWERRTSSSDPHAILDELAVSAGNTRGDWVVGVVTGMPLTAATRELIGESTVLSRRFLLRIANDPGELASLREGLDTAAATTSGEEEQSVQAKRSELEATVEARALQRNVVAFLHDWAHTFGAIHSRAPTAIMAAVPSYTSNVFTPEDVAVIRLGLRYQWRIDAAKTSPDIARERTEWRKELLRLLEGARDPSWETSSRADALAFLREGAPTTLTRLSSSDVDVYNNAANAANKHDYAAAWQAIEMLATRYPTELPVQTLACYIAFWRDKTNAQTVQQCQRASQVDSRAVKPLFMLATALLDTHSDSEAGPVLAELDKRIERQDASSDDWVTLAQLHQVHSDVTLALRSVQRSRDAGAIATYERWAEKQRHLSSLPKEAEHCGILPTNEHEYVVTTRAAYKAFYAQDRKTVEVLATQLATNFPKAPGAAVLRCALAQSRSNLAEAEKQCHDALAIDTDTAMAHYWLALVQISKKNTNQAIDELQRAIDIYPQLKDAWQTLGRVLKQLKKKMQLTELGIRYQNEFNEALDIP